MEIKKNFFFNTFFFTFSHYFKYFFNRVNKKKKLSLTKSRGLCKRQIRSSLVDIYFI